MSQHNSTLSVKRPTTGAQGYAAETQAAEFLIRNGLQFVARNFRAKQGEIDLIFREGATLVFVEVRQRRTSAFGGAAYSITATKRRRLLVAAQIYLLRHPAAACRFDCILLEGTPATLEWIRNAFTADDLW